MPPGKKIAGTVSIVSTRQEIKSTAVVLLHQMYSLFFLHLRKTTQKKWVELTFTSCDSSEYTSSCSGDCGSAAAAESLTRSLLNPRELLIVCCDNSTSSLVPTKRYFPAFICSIKFPSHPQQSNLAFVHTNECIFVCSIFVGRKYLCQQAMRCWTNCPTSAGETLR